MSENGEKQEEYEDVKIEDQAPEEEITKDGGKEKTEEAEEKSETGECSNAGCTEAEPIVDGQVTIAGKPIYASEQQVVVIPANYATKVMIHTDLEPPKVDIKLPINKLLVTFGSLQVTSACICLIVNIVLLACYHSYNWPHEWGVGIWAGAAFCFAGVLGIFSGKFDEKCRLKFEQMCKENCEKRAAEKAAYESEDEDEEKSEAPEKKSENAEEKVSIEEDKEAGQEGQEKDSKEEEKCAWDSQKMQECRVKFYIGRIAVTFIAALLSIIVIANSGCGFNAIHLKNLHGGMNTSLVTFLYVLYLIFGMVQFVSSISQGAIFCKDVCRTCCVPPVIVYIRPDV